MNITTKIKAIHDLENNYDICDKHTHKNEVLILCKKATHFTG